MESSKQSILKKIETQRQYYSEGNTFNVKTRIQYLKAFKASIIRYEKEIYEAFWEDLHKSEHEVYMVELSIVLQELRHHLRHLRSWVKGKSVPTPLALLPSRSKIHYEPYGNTLIIAPFNYPFQLLLTPLVGAISAGNTAILKPSPFVPAINQIIEKIMGEVFPQGLVTMVHGSFEANQLLLKERFDYIFFTGSSGFGKAIMKAAAEYLTPVTLELGGKSPCIVDEDASINMAAKRIVWGKFLNAGQTCIAPDYLMVHESVKDQLLERMKHYVIHFFGENPEYSKDLARIVTDEALERILNLFDKEKVYHGGDYKKHDKFIAPTILTNVSFEDPIMQEEIFGPVLPVISFTDLSDAVAEINRREKPLALYYFSQNRGKQRAMVHNTSAGGTCINDTVIHIANHHLPFGGVGTSGMGKYHGKDSFLLFSNARALVKSHTLVDIPIKYAPYRNTKVLKKLV